MSDNDLSDHSDHGDHSDNHSGEYNLFFEFGESIAMIKAEIEALWSKERKTEQQINRVRLDIKDQLESIEHVQRILAELKSQVLSIPAGTEAPSDAQIEGRTRDACAPSEEALARLDGTSVSDPNMGTVRALIATLEVWIASLASSKGNLRSSLADLPPSPEDSTESVNAEAGGDRPT